MARLDAIEKRIEMKDENKSGYQKRNTTKKQEDFFKKPETKRKSDPSTSSNDIIKIRNANVDFI